MGGGPADAIPKGFVARWLSPRESEVKASLRERMKEENREDKILRITYKEKKEWIWSVEKVGNLHTQPRKPAKYAREL